MKTSKLLSAVLALLTALLILTVSIAAPVLIRPFYYAQINPLRLPQESGMTRGEIIAAYNDVLDYCTGLRADFRAGGLAFSASCAAHFADVRRLFILDFIVALVCAAALSAWGALRKKSRLTPYRLGGLPFYFWGASGLTGAAWLFAAFAAVDFNRAFTLMHTVLFPGKSNWIFDRRVDRIIILMPPQFFAACGILIAAVSVSASIALIAAGIGSRARHKAAAQRSAVK